MKRIAISRTSVILSMMTVGLLSLGFASAMAYVPGHSHPRDPVSSTTTTYTHSTSTASPTGDITVTSRYSNGSALTGMYIQLQDPTTGKTIKAGYTPITFTVTAGVQYNVTANSYKSIVFQTWSYPPTSENPLNYGVAVNPLAGPGGVQAQLQAIYS